MMKLEEFAEINMGQSPVSSSYNENEDGLPFFQGKADFGKINPKAKVWCNKPTKIAEKDDILMSVRAPVGDLNIATAKCCIGRGLAGIRAKKDKCYFKYLFYFLRSKYNELNQMSTGSTFKAISKNNILNIEGNIPEIKEQKIIVSKLDKFQDLIIKTEEQIELLDDLIKSQFIEMFGDININDKLWKEDILRNHLKVIGGYAFKSSEFKNSGIPILRIGNINTGYFRPKDLMFWNEEDKLKNYIIYPNDIVMSLTGTVGKDDYGNVCIMGRDYEKYYLNQRNAKLELKDTLDKIYISYALRVPEIKKRLTGISRGVRQANIANKDIENLYIPIPPIELQNQFADIVKQIDKQKFEIQNELIELKKVKEYLMNKYFN